MPASRFVHVLCLTATLLGFVSVSPAGAQARPARFLAKEDILLYGIGLKVEPARQTVPKDIATIVSTYLQAASQPDGLPPFAPDAEVRATLVGPSFSSPRDLVARPNAPLQIPPLTVPGVHTLENIRLVSNGEVLLYGAPQSVRIEVIERLLVTQVTARPLTAAEIREKGIVYDRSSFQAYNFSAAFAIQDKTVNLNFPVLLPTLQGAADQSNTQVQLQTIAGAQLPSLRTIIPDTLRIQTQVPNLSVVGFTLKAPQLQGQQLVVPPIPGVVVIPGDIGFLNQFFSVMLMVGNVAPAGSNLVVSDMKAAIVLPAGSDNKAGNGDDPLRMAKTAAGDSAPVVKVVQPGPDAKLGTADDILTIGPGETGNAEYLVEGRREGSHVVEMQISATLNGLPIGPVPITGRAAGAVLVRNPKFTLTFTHPEVVSAGEPYTLDVIVTNTSPSPANLVSLNFYPRNVSGATIIGDASRQIDSIAPGDSTTVSFDLVSKITGKVTAATLDSNENVAGRFALKTSVGELNVPLSPDSLVLPKEASSLPKSVRDAAIGLLGKAWAVATAPPAAMPPDLSPFSRKIVLDRAVEVAEAGLRVDLHEPLADSAAQLAMDVAGSNYARLASQVKPADLDFEQTNFRGFDELRRKSIRGDTFAAAVAGVLADSMAAQGAPAFHLHLAERWSYRPAHVSIMAAGAGGLLPYDITVLDAAGRRLGGIANGKVVKEIAFSDLLTFANHTGGVLGQLAILAAPNAGALTVRLTPRAGVPAGAAGVVSVVLPDSAGGLRQVVHQLAAGQMPAPVPANGGPISIGFEMAGATAVPSTASNAVSDPAPTVISVVQQADADQLRCDPAKPGFRAGRIVAVLFSEEVTPQSVQDRLAAQQITNYAPDANQVVGVALQPGRRIAFIALRDPFGPFVARTMTIHDVTDARGHVMASWTGAMEATVNLDGAVVSGRVLDAFGKPMPFADVRLFYQLDCGLDQPQWAGISSKAADANGRYSWDYVSKPLLNRILAVDSETDDFRNVQYNVQAQGQQLNVDIVFLGRGSIQGTTRSEQGVPLADTVIRVTSLTDQSQYAARTDVSGRFSIARVPVGNIFIEAVNTAANAKVAQSDYIPSAGAVVQRDLMLLDVEQRKVTVKHGTVKGFVYRDDGITPAGGLPVFAYYQSNSQPGVTCPPGASPCAIARTATALDGSYTFTDITAGKLSLSSFDQTGLSKAEVSLILAENATATVNLLLSGGVGTVTGKVVTADGDKVAGAQVGGGLVLTTTDSDGLFTLTNVPVGRREIVAVSQALGAIGRTTIDIVRPGETVSTTIVFDAQGTIAGRVVEADGTTPVSGVTVYAFRPSAAGGGYEIAGSAVTSQQGGYSIAHVPAGTFKVSAFNAGFTDGNITGAAVKFNGQTSRADIRFRGGAGKITGTVYNATGNTPLKARVGVSGDRVRIAGGLVGVAFERVENFAIADSALDTGKFNLSGILVGPFTLNAVGQFSPDPISVEGAIPSPGVTVTVDLKLQPTSQVRGTVTNPDGTPVGADVVVRYKSEAYKLICTSDAGGESQCDSIPQGIQEENVVTDTQGRFWLPVVNAGPFSLRIEDPQTGKMAFVKGSVRPGEEAQVPVRLLAQGSVEVRVFGSDTTTAIPGAKVVIRQLGFPRVQRELIASNAGIAAFTGGDGLTEGDYIVEATDLRNGFAGRASGRITVDGGLVVTKVYLFNATGTVQGIVYGADGYTPVANADVIVANPQGPLAFAVTGPDGAYSLDRVPLGAVNVEVFDAKSGRRGTGSGYLSFNGQQAPVNVVLASIGVVKGIVLDEATRGPLKGWTVTLQQRSASGVALPMLTATTGVDGRFAVPGAGRGTFTLTARKQGVSGSGSATGALDLEGQVVDVPVLVTIARTLTGTVTGTVFTANGAPAANAIVEVCAQCGSVPASLTADEFGAFRLEHAPLGRFTVRAHSQTSHDAGSAAGEIRTDGDVAAVVVAMEGVAKVSGTVERTDGSKVAGAQVVFDGFPASACGIDGCTGGTDQQGRFEFVDQPARSFTVTATDPISKLKGTAGGPLAAGENRVVTIVLAPTATLSGRVVTASGQPASGVVAELVFAEKTSNERRLYKQTLNDGSFVFPAAPLETYRLVLSDPVGSGIASRTGQLTGPLALGDIVLDEAPPAIASLTPQASSARVPVNQAITIVFSEAIQPGTINDQHVRLVGANGPVIATRDVVANDTTVVLTPLSPLATESRYTLRIGGVADRVGRAMASDYTAEFTTVDKTAPVLADASPAANTGGVTIYTTIRLRYSEPIDPAKFASAPISVSGSSGAIAGAIDYLNGNTVVVFTPKLPLAENAAYQVQVAAATDVAGNAQASGASYQFSTTDRTPPQIATLTADKNGKVVENGTSTVTADPGTTSDVLFVDFYVNGVLAFVDRSAPFAISFQATPQYGGPGAVINVSAIATDTSGNRGTVPAATTVTVIPDQAPTVAITAPAAPISAKNGDHINVTVHATDDIGVKSVGYRAQTGKPADASTKELTPPSPDTSANFGFDVPASAEPGSIIQIEASAVDAYGHVVAATPVQVTVLDAVAPAVTITGATTGARVSPGQQTRVVVTATDKGGVASLTFTASGVTTVTESRTVDPAQPSVVTSFTVTVPTTAQPGQSLLLDATAIDRAGNSGAAGRVILPIADLKPPVVTLSTENGTLTAVAGHAVRVTATVTDETGVLRGNLSASGAVTFTDAKQVPGNANSASLDFDIPVPANAIPGTTIQVQVTATDITNQTSTPVSLTLTVVAATAVTLPASDLIDAGQTHDVTVQLGAAAPAAGVTVTFTSADANVVTVPASLVFAAGESAKPLTLTGLAGGTTQVRARINGVELATMTVTVAGGIVSGTVRDSLGAAVAGAHVTVTSASAQFSATTGGDGGYRVSGVQGPNVDVRVSDPVTRLYGRATGTMARVKGVVNVNVILIPAGAISGHVTGAGGTPAGAGVKIEIFTASGGAALATTFTDGESAFEFPLVTLGNYTLQATSGLNRGRASASLATSGQQLDTTIVYLGSGTVTGTVRIGNVPVGHAKLAFESRTIFGASAPILTNAGQEGTFTFTGVPIGSFTITAEDQATGQKGSATGQVSSDGQSLTVDVSLAAYGAVTGVVSRAGGSPTVAGAIVTVSGPGYSRQTETDTEGRYRFEIVPLGAYTLTATDKGTHGLGSATVNVDAHLGTKTADIRFLPQGRLLVTVKTADGTPVSSAFVRVDASNGSTQDSLTATTGSAGNVLVEHVLAGNYVVSANFGSLGGAITGSLAADALKDVTVSLDATGSLTGTVYAPNQQTPVAGARVWVVGQGVVTTNGNGVWRMDALTAGRYDVVVYDSQNRVRAKTDQYNSADDLVLTGSNTVTRHFSMIGLGTVHGQVIFASNSQPAGKISVSLSIQAPGFQGARSMSTDGGGNYTFEDVPVGPVAVVVNDTKQRLYGEASGALAAHDGDVKLDIALTSNAITLPRSLYDANNRLFDIQAGGNVNTGSNSLLAGDSAANRGSFSLDIVSGGVTTTFAGGEVPTIEDGSREVVVRQENVAGLSVTRKVFVPRAGYFARYLEVLRNPTPNAITVDLKLRGHVTGSDIVVDRTSSGDAVLDVSDPQTADTWFVAGRSDAAAAAFVVDGAGAARHVSELSLTAAQTGQLHFGKVVYRWNSVTVPAGGTVAVMHFGVQQLSRASALASAGRLAQLPPEALAGLSTDEISAIANFAVPGDGQSALAPLPSLTGVVKGKVLEADNSTVVASAQVSLGSTHPLFGGTRTATSASDGSFTLTGALTDNGTSVAIPVSGFTIGATYPVTAVASPLVTGAVDPQTGIATQNVTFSNAGAVFGEVRRHNTSLVVSGSVEIAGGMPATTRTVAIGADGYRAGGLPPGQYTITATTLESNGNTGITGLITATIAAGPATRADVMIEPTGSLDGHVYRSSKSPAIGVRVKVQRAGFSREVNTDTGGAYAFANMPTGTFTVLAIEPGTGITSSAPVTIAADTPTSKDLTLVTTGRVTATVKLNDQGQSGLQVELRSANPQAGGFDGKATDGQGKVTFEAVPVGAFTLTVLDTFRHLYGEANGVVQTDGQQVFVTLTLVDNAISLPASRYDANNFPYTIQPGGYVSPGWIGAFGSSNTEGAAMLDIDSGAGPVAFVGAAAGTYEDGEREIATRQANVAGLDVTRKVFVPREGYFARYLEILANRSASPITVKVRLRSRAGAFQYSNACGCYSNQVPSVVTTSSGDAAFDPEANGGADRWVTLAFGADLDVLNAFTMAPVAYVFGGANAAAAASGGAYTTTSSAGVLAFEWQNVTIPAGGTTALMHFVVQQVNRAGALAAAQRLEQLPPEALSGLSQVEIASIRNFAVPATGTSTLEPLPSLTGTIQVHAVGSDSVTPAPVPFAKVEFQSTIPMFAHKWQKTADNNGNVTFAGTLSDFASSVAIPAAPFTLTVSHPSTSRTASTTGDFPAGETTTSKNAALTGTTNVSVLVTTFSGTPVAGATVRIDGIFYDLSTGTNGRAVFTGMDPGPHSVATWRNAVSPQTGSAIEVVGAAEGAANATAPVTLAYPAVGQITGTLRTASGATVANRTVTIGSLASSFSRGVATTNQGVFTLTDVPEGIYLLRATDSQNGAPAEVQVTILGGKTTEQDLTLPGRSTVVVTVNFARGQAAPGSQVDLMHAGSGGSFSFAGSTNQSGQLTLQNVPVGEFSVRAFYPGNTSYWVVASGNVTENGGTVPITVTLPAFGAVHGTLKTAKGAPVPNRYVQLRRAGTNEYVTSVDSDNNGNFRFVGVPLEQSFHLAAQHLSVSGLWTYTDDFTLHADGDDPKLDLALGAVATVTVQVKRQGGSGWPGLRIEWQHTLRTYFDRAGLTNQSGELTLNPVPQGPFTVRIRDEQTGVLLGERTGSIAAADDETIVPFAVPVSATIGTVKGRALSSDRSRAVTGATVWISDTAEGTLVKTATTGSDGRFEFADVLGGPQGLTLHATSPNNTAVVVDQPVTITTPGETVTQDVVLPVIVGTVKGRVAAATGNVPLKNVDIYIREMGSSNQGLWLQTDASGMYEAADVPFGGSFSVDATISGLWLSSSGSFTTQGQTVTVDFTMPLTVGSVAGTVYAGDHATALPGVFVYATTATGNDLGSVKTDAQGHYSMPTVYAPGPVWLQTWVGTVAADATVDFAGGAAVTRDLVLPLSVIRGRVTQPDGSAVSKLNLFVESSDLKVTMPFATPVDGRYLVLGAPVGTIRVTAQDRNTSVRKSADGELTDVTVAAVIDITLPATGTVNGTLYDRNNQKVPFEDLRLVSDALRSERFASADGQGAFTFTGVPEGPVTLRTEIYDSAADEVVYLAGSGTVNRTTPVTIDVKPVPAGKVTGQVLAAGVPVTNATVVVRSIFDVEPVEIQTTTDENGRYTLDRVPAGEITVTAFQAWNAIGKATGALAGGGTLTRDITIGSAVAMNYTLTGADGLRYEISTGGELRNGGTANGSVGSPYSYSAWIELNGDYACCSDEAILGLNGRQVTLGPMMADSLAVSRSIYVPEAGGFARYLDVLYNPSPIARTVTVTMGIYPFYGANTRWVVTPASTGLRYAVSDDALNGAPQRASAGYVMTGSGTVPAKVRAVEFHGNGADDFAYQFVVTIQPKQRLAFMHFELQRNPDDGAGAQAAAQALSALSDPNALTGLSAAEKAMIVNFVIAP